MRAIDTNVLVRLLARDDARQVATAARWVEGGVWVSLLALAEAVWVLSAVYECSPVEIASAVETLLNHKDLTLQDSDIVGAALVQFRATGGKFFRLSASRNGAESWTFPLGTFDRDLSKLNGAQRL